MGNGKRATTRKVATTGGAGRGKVIVSPPPTPPPKEEKPAPPPFYGFDVAPKKLKTKQWEAMGGDRLKFLRGSRLLYLGRQLFPEEPPKPPAEHHTLRLLTRDCTETSLSNYLIALQNPECYDIANAEPILKYSARDRWTSIPVQSEHFEFYVPVRLQLDPDDSKLVIELAGHLERAWSQFREWKMRPPLVPKGFTKIPVLLDDLGRVRGDTTPDGPLRLNHRILKDDTRATDPERPTVWLRQALCAHELFHRVQYAYGFRRIITKTESTNSGPEPLPFQYFSEGTAVRAEELVFNALTADSKVQALMAHPELGLCESSYSAFVFWSKFIPDGDALAAFLESYSDALTRVPREDAIRTAIEKQGPRLQVSIANAMRDGLLNPMQIKSPAKSPEDWVLIPSELRVTPVDLTKPVSIAGALHPYGIDVFHAPSGVIAESTDGVITAVQPISATNSLVFVHGKDTPTTYSLNLSVDGGKARAGRLDGPRILKEWKIKGDKRPLIKVALDSFGNVIVDTDGFSCVAFGFQVRMPTVKHQRVFASISGYQPEEPGWGNREFHHGVLDGNQVTLTPINLGGWPGPKLKQVFRSVAIKASSIHVRTILQFLTKERSPYGAEFGLTSLSRTARSTRDNDGADASSCRGDDCDPDTRPCVMRFKDKLFQIPAYLAPGYIVVPSHISFLDQSQSEWTYDHWYDCEEEFDRVDQGCS